MWLILSSVVLGGLLILLSSKIIWYIQLRIALSKLHGPAVGWIRSKGLSTNIRVHAQNLLKYGKQYKDTVVLWFGPFFPVVLVYNPRDAKEVLKDHPKASSYRFLVPWLSKFGLIPAEGETWKRMRKAVSPAFHRNLLKSYSDVTNQFAEELVQDMLGQVGQELDMTHVMKPFTLQVFFKCGFGLDASDDINRLEYAKNADFIVTQVLKRNVAPLKWIDWYYYRTEDGKRLKDAIKYTHDLAHKVLERRKEQISGLSKEDVQKDVGASRPLMDFLDALLMHGHLTDEEIIGQLVTFMFAGMDTSSTALSYSLYEFAQNPKWQDKIRSEILDVLGASGEPHVEELEKLPKLKAFIHETLRLHPPIPFLPRKLKRPTVINGVELPAGAGVVVNLWVMGHNADLWQDPYKFDPNRFLNRDSHDSNYSFVPFSAGPRNCIGQHFAMNEIRITLVHILRKLKMKSIPGFELQPACHPILVSESGVKLILEPLDSN